MKDNTYKKKITLKFEYFNIKYFLLHQIYVSTPDFWYRKLYLARLRQGTVLPVAMTEKVGCSLQPSRRVGGRGPPGRPGPWAGRRSTGKWARQPLLERCVLAKPLHQRRPRARAGYTGLFNPVQCCRFSRIVLHDSNHLNLTQLVSSLRSLPLVA